MESPQQASANDDYLIIPNPIYDVVFRYLMEDLESATIILSTLINEKIIKLEFEPLTHAEKRLEESSIKDTKTENEIRLFHLDFAATIELPDGTEELIMIELQKASEPDDIFRFKRYISQNFQKKQQKEIIDPKTQAVEKINKPIRLIPIFILNFRIENEINDLLIRTNRIKSGVFKNQKLKKHNEFIDNLTYDLWVIQLPNLPAIEESRAYENEEWKQKLFTLLKLFDQKSRVRDNNHRLRLVRKMFPDFLDRVILRLQTADSANQGLEEQMYAEDEYLKALIRRDNRISRMEQKIDEQSQALVEKDKVLNEKDKVLNEQNQALVEKDKAMDQLKLELAKSLKSIGMSIEEIQQKTGLPQEMIEQL